MGNEKTLDQRIKDAARIADINQFLPPVIVFERGALWGHAAGKAEDDEEIERLKYNEDILETALTAKRKSLTKASAMIEVMEKVLKKYEFISCDDEERKVSQFSHAAEVLAKLKEYKAND